MPLLLTGRIIISVCVYTVQQLCNTLIDIRVHGKIMSRAHGRYLLFIRSDTILFHSKQYIHVFISIHYMIFDAVLLKRRIAQ